MLTNNPPIRIESLEKGFGEYPILRDIDLTVEWGELLVVFGANGSGKTTLLKLLSTQYRPDKGEIWIGGIPRSKNTLNIRKIIGVVGHQPMLYEDLTCQENLRFFGQMHQVTCLSQRIDHVLSGIDLEGQRYQKVRTLSHGMQKRLSIGRAILHDPPILLMDEPESGLDQDPLEGMSALVRWRSNCDRTIVMTTHNVDFGLSWANEVAVLSEGRIVYKAHRKDINEATFKKSYLHWKKSAG